MVSELQVYNLFFSLKRSKGSAKSSQILVKKGGLNLTHFAPLTNNIGHSRHGIFRKTPTSTYSLQQYVILLACQFKCALKRTRFFLTCKMLVFSINFFLTACLPQFRFYWT